MQLHFCFLTGRRDSSQEQNLWKLSAWICDLGKLLNLPMPWFLQTDSFEKTLMLGKIEQRMRWLGGHRLNGYEFG